MGSGKDEELQAWQEWTTTWIDLLAPYFEFAPAFTALGFLASASLDRVLRQKPAPTLRRHLPGWRLWYWPMYDPPLLDLVAFTRASGKTAAGGKGALSALKFAAGLTGRKDWLESLSSPVVSAWCKPLMGRQARREALPLPLRPKC